MNNEQVELNIVEFMESINRTPPVGGTRPSLAGLVSAAVTGRGYITLTINNGIVGSFLTDDGLVKRVRVENSAPAWVYRAIAATGLLVE